MTRPERVRFAPSPTGRPHLGNAGTALSSAPGVGTQCLNSALDAYRLMMVDTIMEG